MGAFYGYFSSKEALFASIVEPHAIALIAEMFVSEVSADRYHSLNFQRISSLMRWERYLDHMFVG